MGMNIGRYIAPKARYISRLNTKDGGRLKKKLLETLIEDTVEYYELNSIQEAKARKIVNLIALNNLGNRSIPSQPIEEAKKELPSNWRDIINIDRKKLTTFKQLSKEELELHNDYCSREGCAFLEDNQLCPVVRFGKVTNNE